MAKYYVNTGAPIPRDDGSFVESGTVFIPTADELRRLAYKLQEAAAEEGGIKTPAVGDESKSVGPAAESPPLRKKGRRAVGEE